MEKNQADEKTNVDKDTGAGDGDSLPAADNQKVDGKDGDEAVKEAKEEEKEKKEEEKGKENVDEKTKGDDQELTQQIEETPAVEIHYTLESVAEDIDRFISTLSSVNHSKDKEDDNDDNKVGEKEHEEEQETEKETETEKGNEKEKEKEEVKMKLEVPLFVEKFLDLVEEKVGKGRIFNELQEETTTTSFLESVTRLSNLLAAIHGGFDSDKGRASLINRVGAIQQRAMSYLEDEFRQLLEEPPKHTINESSETGKNAQDRQDQDQPNVEELPTDIFPGYPPETVANLKKISDQMIKAGYEYECREVYVVARRNSLEETLNHHLCYEKLSIDEVHRMPWDSMEREIPTWTKTFKDCATIYFPGEKKLADEVFSDHAAIAADLFTKVARSTEIQLLNFAEAVAMTKRSAEKLFKVLDMYETLRDHFAAVNDLFPEPFAKELKAEANTSRSRLGETAIYMFCDLENSIKSDTGKTPVPGGAVHPLTRYTMNYLRYACEYKTTLEQVFKEHWKIERADSTSRPRHDGVVDDDHDSNNADSKNNESVSPFSAQLMRVMDLLDSNLEKKSKLYKDIPLSCIFMMNNGRYIVQKIKGSAEIHQVMGDTWCRKRSSNLRNYHKNYQRETWGKLLGCLGHEGLMVNGKLVKPVLKERFKSFNAMFDEIHRTQSTWVVSDEQLQSELRVSISAVVIPAYRSFLGRFSQYLDPGRQTEKYIKFQEEDIETYIEELFDGNQASAMARRR